MMKPIGAATALLFALSAPLCAEDPGPELFGGYSYARVDDTSRHGGHAAFALDLRSPLGLKVDVSAHYGSSEGVDLTDLSLMAGPVVRLGRRGTGFFLHALAGLYRERASISVFDVSISESESRFALLGGGGLDLRIARRWALRFEGDYLWSRKDGASASGVRVSTGVVFRPGGRQVKAP
jgi:opacity protein-like surface antigen